MFYRVSSELFATGFSYFSVKKKKTGKNFSIKIFNVPDLFINPLKA